MKAIENITDLKVAIALAEVEQSQAEKQLKQQFRDTYENLKPKNIVLNAIKDIGSIPDLKKNAMTAGFGLVTNFLTKRINSTPKNSLQNDLFSIFQSVLKGIVPSASNGEDSAKANDNSSDTQTTE